MLGEAALVGSPLTLAGLGVLENVNAQPGVTVAEMTRRAPQTQQALSQIAARLQKMGLIERKLVPGTRGIGLHLTDAGLEMRELGHDAVERFESSLADSLGPDRHRRLVVLLEEAETIVRDMQLDRRQANSRLPGVGPPVGA
jgi:DNA-binding MarR family transcriptional regulator